MNFKCNLDRGGHVQNIYFRNIDMEQISDALFIFRMDYHGYRGNNYPTKFNNFYASNITCKVVEKTPFKLVGVDAQPITKIYLHDITIEKAGEESIAEFCENVVLDNVIVNEETIKFDK